MKDPLANSIVREVALGIAAALAILLVTLGIWFVVRDALGEYLLGKKLQAKGRYDEGAAHIQETISAVLPIESALPDSASSTILDAAVTYLVSLGMPETFRVDVSGPQTKGMIGVSIEPDHAHGTRLRQWTLLVHDREISFDERQQAAFEKWLNLVKE